MILRKTKYITFRRGPVLLLYQYLHVMNMALIHCLGGRESPGGYKFLLGFTNTKYDYICSVLLLVMVNLLLCLINIFNFIVGNVCIGKNISSKSSVLSLVLGIP